MRGETAHEWGTQDGRSDGRSIEWTPPPHNTNHHFFLLTTYYYTPPPHTGTEQ
jgi:hypothetical protein